MTDASDKREKFDLDLLLSRLPRPAQHQGSVTEQMAELQKLAVHFGLYDASSWISRTFTRKPDGE